MNQMLIGLGLMGVNSVPQYVTAERLKELFGKSKPAESWEKIKAHENYEKMFYNFSELENQIFGDFAKQKRDDEVKQKIVYRAMLKGAEKGIVIDDVLPEAQEELLNVLDEYSEEEPDKPNVGVIEIII